MIRFLVTINCLGYIVNSSNEQIKAHITKKLSRGLVINAPSNSSEAVSAALDQMQDIESSSSSSKLIWVTGGSSLFSSLLQKADELYIVQTDSMESPESSEEFPCFGEAFTLKEKSHLIKDDGLEFQYQVWQNNLLLTTADSEQA